MDIKTALDTFDLEKWENISSSTLRSLYKDLAKKKHPDVPGGDGDEFVKLQKAYDIIARKVKKKEKEEKKKTTDKSQDPKEKAQEYTKVRDIKNLDKADLMEKFEEIENEMVLYKESLFGHKESISEAKKEVKVILQEFEKKRDELREELEKAVVELEKKYKGTLLNKILFFLPKMSETEFTEKYNRYVNKFSSISADLDSELFKSIIEIYGKALNDIQENVKKIEK